MAGHPALHLVRTASPVEADTIDNTLAEADHLDSFAGRLKYLRSKKGLSQSAFADLIGVTRSAVGQWETSPITPSFSKIEEIARVLGSTPEWLTYRRGSPTDAPLYRGQVQSDMVWIEEIAFGESSDIRHKVSRCGFGRDMVLNFGARPEDLIVFTAPDNSAEPFYTAGDKVFVDASDKRPSPSGVFLYWDGIGAALGTLAMIPSKVSPRVRIAMTGRDPIELPFEELEIIGRVKGRIQAAP